MLDINYYLKLNFLPSFSPCFNYCVQREICFLAEYAPNQNIFPEKFHCFCSFYINMHTCQYWIPVLSILLFAFIPDLGRAVFQYQILSKSLHLFHAF